MALQDRAIDTREKVLLAAARVFDQRGYVGAGMAEIVLGTGMTRGAVYFHFSSKSELARTLIERQHATWPGVQRLVEGEGVQGLAAIRSLLGILGRQLRDDVTARAAIKLAREADAIDDDIASPFDDWCDYLGYRLRQAQLLGQMRSDLDPVTYAGIIVGMFLGVEEFTRIADRELTGGNATALDPTRYNLDAMWELILRGLSVTR
ncbi:ScbR family autoregulator-binding transcription factor [Nocardioides sp.]|uniref:ScbR family autoregulator-binding transcription factor n=1 Tax=Nocardioides sp. TaxID=35761 RepID=UPI002630D3E2|nr:ScbR family autoregulator-binding transcription factor [Nocardioides sp.]